jgi:hypothetical protein
VQAAADYFGLRILVLASYESGAFLWIEPKEQRSKRTLWLSFWAEVRGGGVQAGRPKTACCRTLTGCSTSSND